MSNRIPATKLQQQSYMPDWLLGARVPIPAGIVVACQVTTTSNAPVILKELSCVHGELRLMFTQNSEICASGVFTRSREILPLHTAGNVVSATIETGIIPASDIKYTDIDGQLNPSYVRVVSSGRTGNGHKRIVTIQDGVSSITDITQDIDIKTSSNLRCDVDQTSGTLTISMPNDEKLDYIKLGYGVIKHNTLLNTINGVRPTANGNISINIYSSGKLLPASGVTAQSSNANNGNRVVNWVKIDGSGIPFCPEAVDIIDSYVAPDTHPGYLPLDDLYECAPDNPKSCVRATEKADDYDYGGFNGGGTVGLTQVDPNIDDRVSDSQ